MHLQRHFPPGTYSVNSAKNELTVASIHRPRQLDFQLGEFSLSTPSSAQFDFSLHHGGRAPSRVLLKEIPISETSLGECHGLGWNSRQVFVGVPETI
jgi:hypothetical protein